MSLVASNYAQAFLELAIENNSVESFKNELDEVKKLFASVDGLEGFFSSVKISKEEKKNLIDKSLGKELSKLTINFIKLLIDKGRIGYFAEIADEFHHLCNKELHIKEGVIESARPLNKEQIEKIEKVLSKDGETVELIAKVNKTLISGFKVSLDDMVVDNTMKDKIRKLTEELHRKDVNSWN